MSRQIRESTYTDRTGHLVISPDSVIEERTYETTKAETGIEYRVCDIGQDDILGSSDFISQGPTGVECNLPGTETTEGRKHTHRTEGNETENGDLEMSISI